MNVTLLPSSVTPGGPVTGQYLTSYLINGTLALDCGSLGYHGTPQDQARVRHVLLSHTHIDHVGSLPIFLENAYEARADCVTVHASDVVLDCLRSDMFNGRLWPDFIGLSTPEAGFLRLSLLEPNRTVELEGLRVTPVPVNHVVPTLGFIVEDDAAAVAFSSDTGPTEELWERANEAANLKAVFLEATFPDSMTDLALISKHLTASMFAEEVRKLKRRRRKPVALYAVHLKARFRDEVLRELHALGVTGLEVCEAGKTYTF